MSRNIEAKLSISIGKTASEEILSRYQTLGNRVKLSHKLSLNIVYTTQDIYENIVSIRNKATHQGITPKISDLNMAFNMTEEIVFKNQNIYE